MNINAQNYLSLMFQILNMNQRMLNFHEFSVRVSIYFTFKVNRNRKNFTHGIDFKMTYL